MSNLRIESDAADELARELLRAGDKLTELQAVNDKAGDRILAATNVPRRSGRLAASVQADAGSAGTVIGSALRYATFVHWGAPRRGIQARPFLLQAIELTQDELVELYAEHARTTVNEIG